MTKSDLLKMRLRFLLLVAAIVTCACVSTVHIRAVAGTFAYRLEGYGEELIAPEDLSIMPEGMARVVEVSQDPDGTYVAVIEGVEPGEGFLCVNLSDAGGMSELRVRKDLSVVADGINFTGWKALPASVALCFAVAGVLCVWAVLTLRAHAWYGYEMAAYVGGAVFCLVEAGVFAWLLASGEATSNADFAIALTQLATRFVYLMLVPTAAAALFVCLSNVELVRHEGRHPTNLLGIAASLAFALACMVLRLLDEGAVQALSFDLLIAIEALDSVFSIGICFGLALLAGASTCAYGAAKHVPSFPRDYLIILGCGLRADGSPTPLLAGRVDAALAYAQAQRDEGGPAVRFVPSGGKGSDEVCSEAESMRRYLSEHGVGDGWILPENRSTNTRENFRYSAEIIANAQDGETQPRIAFATTNYHVFRGYVYAHDAGLDAEGIAAPTKLYFWPNAFLREFVGLLASRTVPIGLTYVVIAGLYLLAEYAVLLAR